jgi:hypothetical protein
VGDRLHLTTHVVRHGACVVAEPLVEGSLEPLTAVGVREQTVEPCAEVPSQISDGPGLGRHAVSVARRLDVSTSRRLEARLRRAKSQC